MAYSEAEVLAGGLAHIPVLIGVLLFCNNLTKSQYHKVAKEKSTNQHKDSGPGEAQQASQTNPVVAPRQASANYKAKVIEEKEDTQPQLEQRLQAEANRLEAETEAKEKEDAEKKARTSHDLYKTSQGFNPWQLAAIALLTIGGGSIFLIESSKDVPLKIEQFTPIKIEKSDN